MADLNSVGTCPHCSRTYYGAGTCPRCTGVHSLQSGTRVCVRVGAKWPGAESHTLAYLVECVDTASGMVLAWDLTRDEQTEVPLMTAAAPWTRKPTRDEQLDARDTIEREIRGKVTLVARIDAR